MRLRAHSMAVKSASNKQPQGVPGHVQFFAWSPLIFGLLLTDRAKASISLGEQMSNTEQLAAKNGDSDAVAKDAGGPQLPLKYLFSNFLLSEYFFLS